MGVVTSRVAVHSALFLLVHFVTLAYSYVTLDAQFLAAAQVIIYAGGIVILILFVIMLIGSEQIRHARRLSPVGAVCGYGAWGLSWSPHGLCRVQTPVRRNVDHCRRKAACPNVVGMALFTQIHSAVELAAVLLLGGAAWARCCWRDPQEEV